MVFLSCFFALVSAYDLTFWDGMREELFGEQVEGYK